VEEQVTGKGASGVTLPSGPVGHTREDLRDKGRLIEYNLQVSRDRRDGNINPGEVGLYPKKFRSVGVGRRKTPSREKDKPKDGGVLPKSVGGPIPTPSQFQQGKTLDNLGGKKIDGRMNLEETLLGPTALPELSPVGVVLEGGRAKRFKKKYGSHRVSRGARPCPEESRTGK